MGDEFLDRETSVNAAPALSRMSVGVVLERRKATSPWTDFSWRPVAVLPGRPQAEPWTVLAIDGEAATFYAGAVDLMLHRTETGQYRDNLASGAPSLWVALRTTGGEPPLRVVESRPIRRRASHSRRRATISWEQCRCRQQCAIWSKHSWSNTMSSGRSSSANANAPIRKAWHIADQPRRARVDERSGELSVALVAS